MMSIDQGQTACIAVSRPSLASQKSITNQIATNVRHIPSATSIIPSKFITFTNRALNISTVGSNNPGTMNTNYSLCGRPSIVEVNEQNMSAVKSMSNANYDNNRTESKVLLIANPSENTVTTGLCDRTTGHEDFDHQQSVSLIKNNINRHDSPSTLTFGMVDNGSASNFNITYKNQQIAKFPKIINASLCNVRNPENPSNFSVQKFHIPIDTTNLSNSNHVSFDSSENTELLNNVAQGTSDTDIQDAYSESCWVCSVCNVEVACLNTHLALHSKEELINALVKSSEIIQRPGSDKSVTTVDSGGESAKDLSCLSEVTRDMDFTRSSETIYLVEDNSIHEDQEGIQIAANDYSTINDSSDDNMPICDLEDDDEFSDPDDVLEILEPQSPNDSMQKRTIKSKKRSSRTPLPCPVCRKVLSNRGNLTKHMNLHDQIKPWNCPTCNMGFNSNRAFKHHQLQTHAETPGYNCDVCHKTFAVKDNLKEHMLFHGPRTKSCDICGKRFWTSKCVSRHRKRHFLPEKKHTCGICNRSFAIKWDCRVHCRRVHGVEHCPSY